MHDTREKSSNRQEFAQRGLRFTRQRQVIYDALCATRAHPTADELYQTCCAGDAEMSLATVYNTLEKLVAAGMVQKLPGAGLNGSARYDASVEDHLHVRDTVTGRVLDAPDELGTRIMDHIPARVLRRIEEELGFEIEHVSIELVGRFKHTLDHARRA